MLLDQVIAFIHSYSDVYAWSYSDLEGIPLKIGIHTIPLVEGAWLVRGWAYKLNPKYVATVKAELKKLEATNIIVLV